MRLANGRECHVLADITVEVETDPTVLKSLYTALDNVLFEFETGNPIDQQTAAAIIAVIHRHLITLATQLFGRR
ncbi:MAG: Uncharacterised protein [Hyphomonas sp. TMED17]|nr:MAG: Uncharacterised protein [Hyphomonas sp. TMED17]